jgi:hypothetical protein
MGIKQRVHRELVEGEREVLEQPNKLGEKKSRFFFEAPSDFFLGDPTIR